MSGYGTDGALSRLRALGDAWCHEIVEREGYDEYALGDEHDEFNAALDALAALTRITERMERLEALHRAATSYIEGVGIPIQFRRADLKEALAALEER